MNEFSKTRSFFFPIHKHELKTFVPMLLLFFLVAFNYHLLKIAKDALIITAPQSGAEVIPFLKVWAILPSAIAMTFLFTSLSNRFNKENIFYIMSFIFIAFFLVFIHLLYPKGAAFQLNGFADSLQKIVPSGLKGFVAIIRYWPFALFYIMAESWSTIMLSILIWGFTIDVIPFDQAKRFYSFFGTSRNISGMLAGKFGIYFALQLNNPSSSMHSIASILGGDNPWDQTLTMFVWLIIITTVLTMGIYKWTHKYVFPTRVFIDKSKPKKEKISLRSSLSYLLKSKYMLYIAVIILSYNITINLTEVLWKSQMKELFPSSSEYTAYTSKVTYFTGLFAAISSYFLSGNIIRKLGWKFASMITPISILISGLGFFYFLFIKHVRPDVLIFGFTPIYLAVFFGSMQNVFSRAFKYTLFDDTKEMALIPLSYEDKMKGKSLIDGIGSRVGKSGSSLLMQFMIILFGSTISCSPFIFLITLVVLPVWMISLNKISKNFEKASKPQESTVKVV